MCEQARLSIEVALTGFLQGGFAALGCPSCLSIGVLRSLYIIERLGELGFENRDLLALPLEARVRTVGFVRLALRAFEPDGRVGETCRESLPILDARPHLRRVLQCFIELAGRRLSRALETATLLEGPVVTFVMRGSLSGGFQLALGVLLRMACFYQPCRGFAETSDGFRRNGQALLRACKARAQCCEPLFGTRANGLCGDQGVFRFVASVELGKRRLLARDAHPQRVPLVLAPCFPLKAFPRFGLRALLFGRLPFGLLELDGGELRLLCAVEGLQGRVALAPISLESGSAGAGEAFVLGYLRLQRLFKGFLSLIHI